jgi:bacteriocin-like protein
MNKKGKSSGPVGPVKVDKAAARGKAAPNKAQELSDKDLQKVSGGIAPKVTRKIAER